MAFAADTIVIWDPLNGNNANGGGFAASDGGARITSPIAYDDLVIDGADNTKLTSAADRAFVANDAGNWLNVTGGTGFTVQRARIVSVASGVATMDRAMGTTSSTGGTGNLGGYLQTFTDALLELSVAGMQHHVWATATMTFGGHIEISVSGTAALPIIIEGRASDGSANPQGSNRPVIAQGAYVFDVRDYTSIFNIIATGSQNYVMNLRSGGVAKNCKVTNNSGSAGCAGIACVTGSVIHDCDAVSTNGTAISSGNGSRIMHCYAHDSLTGIYGSTGGYTVIDQCIAEQCSTVGLSVAGSNGAICNNTVDTCGIGISGAATHSHIVMNNIFSNCTTGASWSSSVLAMLMDFNNFYNCSTDRTNVAAGPNDNDVDPDYTDAAGGDFSLDTGTGCDDTGFGIRLGVG